MLADEEFAKLIQRVQAGDQDAARQCVRHYEPEIRRAARVRLSDPRLRRIVDSVDICQSVFGRFFARAAEGQCEVESPEQLLALLATMTRNKITDVARRQTAARRDMNRRVSGVFDRLGVADGQAASPSSIAAGRELIAQVYELMTDEELDLVQRRERGDSWAEIADATGDTAEALRKRLERAFIRIRKELGVG